MELNGTNNSNLTFKRGEVYFVDPTGCEVGSEQRNKRPAVVVSNNLGNTFSKTVEVVYITTATKAKLPTHISIDKNPRLHGIVLCESVYTVDKSRLLERVTELTQNQMCSIDKALCISLDITKKSANDNEKVADIAIEKTSIEVDGSESNSLIKKLNEHIKSVYNLGSELHKTESEIDKIMQSDVVLTGIEEDYLSDELKTEIKVKVVERVSSKKTQIEKDIERLLGISNDAVTIKTHEENEHNNVEPKPLSYTVDEVQQLTNSGWTQQKIADKFCTSISTINKFMKANGIKKPIKENKIPAGRIKMSKEEFKMSMLNSFS